MRKIRIFSYSLLNNCWFVRAAQTRGNLQQVRGIGLCGDYADTPSVSVSILTAQTTRQRCWSMTNGRRVWSCSVQIHLRVCPSSCTVITRGHAMGFRLGLEWVWPGHRSLFLY